MPFIGVGYYSNAYQYINLLRIPFHFYCKTFFTVIFMFSQHPKATHEEEESSIVKRFKIEDCLSSLKGSYNCSKPRISFLSVFLAFCFKSHNVYI